MLGLQPRTFNCQLENVKSQKEYAFNLVYQELLSVLGINVCIRNYCLYEGLMCVSEITVCNRDYCVYQELLYVLGIDDCIRNGCASV